MAESLSTTNGTFQTPVAGTAAIPSQLPGQATTVSAVAGADGGIGGNGLIQPDVDEQLSLFNQDDTALMQLMFKAKKVIVNSPIVDHYMIDEPRASVEVASNITGGTRTAVLSLVARDQDIAQVSSTLLVEGVDGYDAAGSSATPGRNLMLFVVGKDASSNNPIVIAVNGPKTNADDAYCTVPAIPAGTRIIVLSNALYETQKEVAPDLCKPQPTRIYLQKRGMNQIVSDYFDSQRKRIPFTQALIAERAIAAFKAKGNRTLWAGRASQFVVDNTKLGPQTVYTTEGVRWQFKKELQHTGRWTIEELIRLAKMFFTGEDVPKTAICLCGKDFLENIQCIDYSKHPEIQVTSKINSIGWTVTNIHTVFGDIELKREPTLDYLGWSRSAALIGENRLVHYVYKSESSFNENVEGEEAKRSGLIVWDGLALKGSCHIWIDGEGTAASTTATTFVLWNESTAPTVTSGTVSPVYYLGVDVATIDEDATAGTFWQYDGSDWVEYEGTVSA